MVIVHQLARSSLLFHYEKSAPWPMVHDGIVAKYLIPVVKGETAPTTLRVRFSGLSLLSSSLVANFCLA